MCGFTYGAIGLQRACVTACEVPESLLFVTRALPLDPTHAAVTLIFLSESTAAI